MALHKIKLADGFVNTDEPTILRHVQSAIRRQLPQVRAYQPQGTSIAVVAGGPSLASTLTELRDLVWAGTKVCAVNGSYRWLVDRNLKPDLAVMLDARPDNADFFETPVPGCQYLIASQCAPETFDRLEGRQVYVWHAASYDTAELNVLTAYYGGEKHHWPVTGGSTVTLRAISLLRMLGFLRMELFGFDSCWMGRKHHSYAQPLNDADRRMRVVMRADGVKDRVFYCAPWHMKQWQDFQLLVRERGHMFDLNVHGDGLIAHGVRTGARLVELKAAQDGDENRGSVDATDSRRPDDAGSDAAEDSERSDVGQGADLAAAGR